MIPFLRHISSFQRLIINSLCLISQSVIYPIFFVFNQLRFFFKYFVFGLPHPVKKIEAKAPAADQKKEEENIEIPFNLARRREQLINEIIVTEKLYQDKLDIFADYYNPALSPIVDKDTLVLFFGTDFSVLIDTSVRVYVTAKEDSKFGPNDTIIGKTFLDAYDYLLLLDPYVDNYLKALLKFNDLYHSDKNFKKKIQSVERRTDTTFKGIFRMPLERLVKYQTSLEEIIKNTPEWHEDYAYLKEIIEKFRPTHDKAQTQLDEGDRILALLKLERKIRGCPPLRVIRRSFVGTWQLSNDNMLIHVLTDRLLIVQQKTELLSRKKYFVLKKDISLANVKKVTKDEKGIKLISKDGDVIIKIKLKVDELFKAIKENNLIARHSEI